MPPRRIARSWWQPYDRRATKKLGGNSRSGGARRGPSVGGVPFSAIVRFNFNVGGSDNQVDRQDLAIGVRGWTGDHSIVKYLVRLSQRILILGLGMICIWLIVFVVFRITDRRLPWILALSLTYAVAAYIILPRAVAWV